MNEDKLVEYLYSCIFHENEFPKTDNKKNKLEKKNVINTAMANKKRICIDFLSDEEFPDKYFADFLEYIDETEASFWETVNQARPNHLWQKKANTWELKNPIWRE